MKFASLAATLVAAALAAASAQAADLVPLKPGTTYTMKRTGADGASTEVVSTVGKDQSYGGTDFTVVQISTGLSVWLRKDTRALAYVMRGDKTIEQYGPDWGDWKWPLAVGASWNSTYSAVLSEANVNARGAQATWTVAAEETVEVPAGRFKTLRIERNPGNLGNHLVTRWYAPEIGLVVKVVDARTNQPGRIVQELVSYKLAP
jgi:opacity protein-like surface antigen